MSYKISVIIPAYNEQKYIRPCIDHLLENNQKYIHEIIVVDNASTDKTEEIAKSYKNIVYIKEDKKGLVKARQTGYRASTGDILAYIDADTKVPPDWVDRIVKSFNDDDNLVFLSGPYIYYDTNLIQKLLVWIYWVVGGYTSYLLVGYLGVGGNMAMKKNMLDKIGGFDTTIEFYGEDTDIARRASKIGKCKFDLNFVNYTSARRLKQQGWVNTGYTYMKNFLSEIISKKPSNISYKDWR